MQKGILLALSACFLWGLIFVVPLFLEGFDPLEIALGRHGINGIVSCLFLLFFLLQAGKRYPLKICLKAFRFSLFSNIIYYFCVVMGVKHSTPAITALVLGIAPVTISFYGNWIEKECDFRKLILPSLVILAGLFLINIPVLLDEEWSSSYMMGALCALIALLAWSWYVVANSRFLKSCPEIRPEEWATLLGSATMIWVIIVAFFYEFCWEGNCGKFFVNTPELWTFIGGCAVLGIFCSWVGSVCWNTASSLLPVSLAGQLTIFETVFGLLFIYMIQQELPPLTEVAGIVLMLSAIVYGINTFAAKKPVAALPEDRL